MNIFLEIFDNILCVLVLLSMIMSFFVSIVYSCAFILVPFDPETKNETNPLLDGGTVKVRASADAAHNASDKEPSSSDNDNRDENQTMYLQMTLYTLAYALICAVRFNSIKALLQITWPADETTVNLEVYAYIYHIRSSKLIGVLWWQGFNKPYLMSWTAQAGLALIAPFSGLSIVSMEYELRWKIFFLTFFGTLSVVFFSWAMLYLPVSISVLIRVCAPIN